MKSKIWYLGIIILFALLISSVCGMAYATTDEEYFRDFTGLYLVDSEITLAKDEVNKVKVEVYGNPDIKRISADFLCFENGENFNAKLEGDINSNNTYFVIPSSVKANLKYQMMYVNVVSADGTFTAYPTTSGLPGYMNTFEKKYLTIKENDSIELKGLEFEKGEIDLDKESSLKVSKLEIVGDTEYDIVSVCLRNDRGDRFGPGAIHTSYSGIINLNLTGSSIKLVKGTTYYLTDIFIMSADGKLLKHYATSKGSSAVDTSNVEYINIDYSLKVLDNSIEESKEVDMLDFVEVDEQYYDEPTVIDEPDYNSPVSMNDEVDVENVDDSDKEEKNVYEIDEETKTEIKKEILEEIKEFIIALLKNLLK